MTHEGSENSEMSVLCFPPGIWAPISPLKVSDVLDPISTPSL